MLFIGTTELNIDAKGRLAIPARYRSQFPEGESLRWVSMAWPNNSIRLYPFKTFLELSREWAAKLIQTEDAAELRTQVFSRSQDVEQDSAGRIRVPQEHLTDTGLTGEVVLLGAGTYLEIRDRAAWLAEAPKRFSELPELIARITRSPTP